MAVYMALCSQWPLSSIVTQPGIRTAISRMGNSYKSVCKSEFSVSTVIVVQFSGTTVRAYFLPVQWRGGGRRHVWLGAVEQDDIRLAAVVQLGNDALLGVKVGFPREIADGAVRRDDQPDGGMLPMTLLVPVSAARSKGLRRRTKGF